MAIVENSKTKLTYSDYVLLPDDGKIHEIIDGDHYMTPAPETYHQTLSRRLQFELYRHIEETGLGVVYDAPTDVQLSETDIVQPDIFVIKASRTSIISPTKILGPPDLIIEILSGSTTTKDRELKLDLYQKSGVPEYWLVNPESHIIEVRKLIEGAYRLDGRYSDTIRYIAITDIEIDLNKVWKGA